MNSDEDTESPKSTEQSSEGSTSSETEHEPGEVADDQLPEDLRPSEENPLARHPEQTGDADDAIGEDREGGTETAPLDKDDADYGSGGSV
jgi:hypothetical protein